MCMHVSVGECMCVRVYACVYMCVHVCTCVCIASTALSQIERYLFWLSNILIFKSVQMKGYVVTL